VQTFNRHITLTKDREWLKPHTDLLYSNQPLKPHVNLISKEKQGFQSIKYQATHIQE